MDEVEGAVLQGLFLLHEDAQGEAQAQGRAVFLQVVPIVVLPKSNQYFTLI